MTRPTQRPRYYVTGLTPNGRIRRFSVLAANDIELASGILLQGVREVLRIVDPVGVATKKKGAVCNSTV